MLLTDCFITVPHVRGEKVTDVCACTKTSVTFFSLSAYDNRTGKTGEIQTYGNWILNDTGTDRG